MTQRLNCLVPVCRRTRGIRKGETHLPEEWICGEHWALVPKRMRAIRARTKRAGTSSGDWRRDDRIWRRVAKEAIERSMGL